MGEVESKVWASKSQNAKAITAVSYLKPSMSKIRVLIHKMANHFGSEEELFDVGGTAPPFGGAAQSVLLHAEGEHHHPLEVADRPLAAPHLST